jgi:hypothetical protein
MDNDLGLVLRSLAPDVEWPEPSTGFSAHVSTRIRQEPKPRRVLRRFVPALAALAVVAVALVVFSPTTRDAVADFLGIGGVRVEYGADEGLPTPRPEDPLDLGRSLSLEEARAEVDFEVMVPGALGDPDEVFLENIVPADMVSLVYLDPHGDVDVLMTEFEGELVRNEGFIKKLIFTGTKVRRVEVNGTEAYWFSGDPHVFQYRTDGVIREEGFRLVEKALLWVQDGVTMRIETARPLKEALEIAASLN